jgi:SAM-dependent methyltransferase
VPILLRRTAGGTPLDTLIRLFLVGVPVDAESCRAAIGPMTLEDWAAAGLVAVEGDSVVGAVQLLPYQEMWLASDRPQKIASGLAADYVMGIGSSSLTLANLTIRRPSRRTLDLGTGSGFQALLAARHSAEVVAADRNPRAVAFAAFNARLNGLDNVECLEGDLFEPVRGRQFDLVVSNPPFVISPESRYIYRDSGLGGDAISQTIVRQVPAFLTEGGFCQVLCNWAHLAGQDWRDRLAMWFAGTGCDAWVMRSDTLDAAGYAAKWIRHTERDSPEQFHRRLEEWLAYYERAGIEAISGGLITIRRRSGATHWFRADDAPAKMLGPAGDGILLGFALRDYLEAARNDELLLAERFRVSPDACLHERYEHASGGWCLAESELAIRRGLAYAGSVDPYVARLLARCDGRAPLGGLLRELAQSLGQDPPVFAAACLAVVRRLVEQGFLIPASLWQASPRSECRPGTAPSN